MKLFLTFTFLFAFCACFIGNDSAAQAPTNGLVAYYPFNGNANDESSNGNTGTPYGATLTTDRKTGNLSGAYNFGGFNNSSFIEVPNSNSLQFTNEFSVSLWYSLSTYEGMEGYGNLASQGYHMLFAKDADWGGFYAGTSGNAALDSVYYNFTNNLSFGNANFDATAAVKGTAANLNIWIHMSYVVENGTAKIFRNGVLIKNQSIPNSLNFSTANTKNLYLGRYSSFWYPLNGKMDDVRVYNRALSDAEVQQLYTFENTGIPQPCPTCISGITESNFSTNEHFCAAQNLCAQGIIQKAQTDPKVSLKRSELAKVAYLSLLGRTNTTIAENYDVPFVDLQRSFKTDTSYYKYAKVLTYLQYQDGKSPFDYNAKAYFNPNDPITRAVVLKVLLETWNIDESTATGASPFSDVLTTHPYYNYIKKAHELGVVTGIAGAFSPDANCSREDAFLMLQRIRASGSITKPTLAQINAGFFKPGNYSPATLSVKPGVERGNFNHYTKTSMALDGVVPLVFAHSYNSYLTELPQELFPAYMSPGWTHSFNCYIKAFTEIDVPSKDQRYVVHYPDGRFHFYKPTANLSGWQPEGIGVYDDFVKVNGVASIEITTPSKIKYTFGRIAGANLSIWPLLSIKDRNNNTLTLTYEVGVDNIPRLKTVKDPGNRTFNFSYLAGTNYLTQVSLSGVGSFNGRNVTFEYSPSFWDDAQQRRNLIKYNEPDAVSGTKATEYSYYQAAADLYLLKQIKLPKGNIIDNQYENRKLTSSRTLNGSGSPVQKMESSFTPTYAASGTTSTSTVSVTAGAVTKATNYAHNNNGLTTRLQTTGSNPMDLKMYYGMSNDPTSVTRIVQKEGTQDSTGVRIEYYPVAPYNVKLVKTAKAAGDSVTQSFVYNAFNEIINYTNGRGFTTSFVYNGTGNLTQINHPIGSPTSMNRNSTGLITQITTPTNIATSFTYNTYGNLTNTSTANGANPALTTSASYDALSRVVSKTDARSQTVTYDYFANDLLKKMNAPLNYYVSYGYDANDNNTTVTNAKGNATTNVYDPQTDQLMSRSFGSKTESFAYYEDGSLKTFTNGRGNVFNFTYDPSGRLTNDGYSAYTFNTDGTLNTVAHTQGAKTYTLDYDYDLLKRVNKTTCDGFAVQYRYDNNNNLDRLTYTDGKTVTYSYDSKDRITSVTDWAGRITTYTYDDDGKVKSYTLPNTTKATYTYDAAGRPTGIAHQKSNNTVLSSYTFALDQGGNHLEENIIEPFATPPTLTAGTTNYTTNARNETTSAGSNSYTFDANGAITNQAGQAIAWDSKDNLLTRNGITYYYDGNETRRAKTGKKYVINELSNSVLVETNEADTHLYYYVYGPTGLLYRQKASNGVVEYYHYDFRGSTTAMTDASQNVVRQYQYDAYGKVLQQTPAAANDDNPFRYVGQHGVQYEADNLYFMRARYYDPTNGRFLSEDPIWSTNLFAYGENNPILNLDPYGLESFPAQVSYWGEDDEGGYYLSIRKYADKDVTFYVKGKEVLTVKKGDYLVVKFFYNENNNGSTAFNLTGGLAKMTITRGALSDNACIASTESREVEIKAAEIDAFLGIKNGKIGAEFGVSNSASYTIMDKTIDLFGYNVFASLDFNFNLSFGGSIDFTKKDIFKGKIPFLELNFGAEKK